MPDDYFCVSGVTMDQFIEAMRQARESMAQMGRYANVAAISLVHANFDDRTWRQLAGGHWIIEEKNPCPMVCDTLAMAEGYAHKESKT